MPKKTSNIQSIVDTFVVDIQAETRRALAADIAGIIALTKSTSPHRGVDPKRSAAIKAAWKRRHAEEAKKERASKKRHAKRTRKPKTAVKEAE